MGHFFRHRELPLVLLALLERSPQSGYDLMTELARRFGPRYRPSGGSVYPALEGLEAEGLIESSSSNGSRRVLALTRQGRAALAERGTDLAAIELRTGVRLAAWADVDAAVARLSLKAHSTAELLGIEAVERVIDDMCDRLDRLTNRPSAGRR